MSAFGHVKPHDPRATERLVAHNRAKKVERDAELASRDARTVDEKIADALAGVYADPLGYVMLSFPWDRDKSIQMVKLPKRFSNRFNSEYGPDEWACDFLDELGQEIKLRGFDGKVAVPPIRMGRVSGHGIGKSALVGFIAKFIMDTRPFARGVMTANTAEQLRTKTWAEVGKWHKRSLTAHWFDYNTGRGSMSLVHKEHPQEWRLDAQTSREENSEAFAGLHAANSTPFYIFDEASAIPDKIFEVREGGTTDGEPMLFDFGNGTRNTGRFYEECVGSAAHRWKVASIDSRNVQITNKARIQEWIDDYGEDSDFVKVRVRGMFPAASSMQFIATASVEEAMTRQLVLDRFAPLVLGVDVARGNDDASVIYPRMGKDARSFPRRRFYNHNSVQLAARVIAYVKEFRDMGVECKAIFVDGTGVGSGVVDQLRNLGYACHSIAFGATARDNRTYRYRVDEMWGLLKNDLDNGLCLPDERRSFERESLKTQLTERQYGHTLKGQIRLETKEDMKDRGVASPDDVDALAITYAEDVAPTKTVAGSQGGPRVLHDHDPLQE